MKKETINRIINAHVKDHLSPKPAERDMVSSEYETLCGFVGGTCLQSGSYARFTSTTPVNDLDVIWQIPDEFLDTKVIRKSATEVDPNHLDPSQILLKLAKDLESSYKRIGRQVRIKAQSHSVGIYFGKTDDEFSIDLVPAIPTGKKNSYGDDVYWVPQIAELSKRKRIQKYSAKESIDWIKSDPLGYITDARELNERNEDFRRAAKFIRKWRRGCKDKVNFPLKSFHLELIVNDIFKQSPDINTINAVIQFLDELSAHLVAPSFVDRAESTRFVDEYVSNLTLREREIISGRILAASAAVQEMVGSASTEEDVRVLMRQILAGEERYITSDITTRVPTQITLGETSHKQELTSIGIIDYGTYPCQVRVGASIWFRGPRDRNVNRRYRRNIASNTLVPIMHEIKYEVLRTDAPQPYRVYWQVVNTGAHAEKEGGLRGEIFPGSMIQWEHSLYTGKHWIECFLVTEEDVCIARSDRFYVSFINPSFPVALLQ